MLDIMEEVRRIHKKKRKWAAGRNIKGCIRTGSMEEQKRIRKDTVV